MLALVSQDFLNSSYIQNVEVARSLERRSRDGMIVYPIIVSPCNWKSESWLSGMQFQPGGGRTVSGDFDRRADRQKLYLEILQELSAMGRKITASRARGADDL